MELHVLLRYNSGLFPETTTFLFISSSNLLPVFIMETLLLSFIQCIFRNEHLTAFI